MDDFGDHEDLSDRRGFLGAGVSLIGVAGVVALAGGCARQAPCTAVPAGPTSRRSALPTLKRTPPLPSDFGRRLRNSKLLKQFGPAFVDLECEPNFEAAVELHYDGLPETARGSRTALIPLMGSRMERPVVWLYTANAAGREGAEIIEVLADNRFRFFPSPNLANGFELIYGADNRLLGLQLFGAVDDPRLQYVLACIAIAIGLAPGALQACYAVCVAGGVANPACLLCIGAAAAVALLCWWSAPSS